MYGVVMGVDPGTRSIGIVVLRGGTIVSALSVVSKRKERGDESDRYISILTAALDSATPAALGLEDYEPQPWRTGGRQPRGGVAHQRLVTRMREVAQRRGILVYTQSPQIQAQYEDEAARAMFRKAMGDKIPMTEHVISALKHALYAETTYRQTERRP